MKKIKIVHYLPNLTNGGIEMMLFNYYQKIKNQCTFVVIIHESPAPNCLEKFESNGIKVYQIEHWSRNLILNFKQLHYILKIEKPDFTYAS